MLYTVVTSLKLLSTPGRVERPSGPLGVPSPQTLSRMWLSMFFGSASTTPKWVKSVVPGRHGMFLKSRPSGYHIDVTFARN